MQRFILHCDMNNFYASVECMLNRDIKGKPVIVCGSLDKRHGIVLARNYLAKQFDIIVGDTIWKAQQKCKNVIVVSPPNFHEYEKYSKLAHNIYLQYTDRVEPYGIDECWLDISNSCKNYEEAKQIADNIRKVILFKLGLTISVGVSFNKVFAKLGSDIRKPNATTLITENNYKSTIWQLPAASLLGVGRSTQEIFKKYYIHTIYDLAIQPDNKLQYLFGKHGLELKKFANGLDDTEVLFYEDLTDVKSISHGITTTKDLKDNNEVWKVILSLSKDIGSRLRIEKKRAKGVSLSIRDNLLVCKQWQKINNNSMQTSYEIAKSAYDIFIEKYNWKNPIRTVTIQAIKLIDEHKLEQVNLFTNLKLIKKIEQVEKCNENLNKKFGKDIVKNAILLKNDLIPKIYQDETTPTGFSKRKLTINCQEKKI